jgi:hypothetical protein
MVASSTVPVCAAASLVTATPLKHLRNDLHELTLQFHNMLLQNASGMTIPVVVDAHDPLTATWSAFGQTAGIVVRRRGPDVPAISAFAAGLDHVEDAKAIALAVRTCNLRSWRASALTQIAMSRRPLLATLSGSPAAIADPVIATAAAAWATAFFAMLGVEQETASHWRARAQASRRRPLMSQTFGERPTGRRAGAQSPGRRDAVAYTPPARDPPPPFETGSCRWQIDATFSQSCADIGGRCGRHGRYGLPPGVFIFACFLICAFLLLVFASAIASSDRRGGERHQLNSLPVAPYPGLSF